MSKGLSQLFFFIGLACLAVSAALLFQHYSPYRLPFTSYTTTPAIACYLKDENPPKTLRIKALHIELPIIPSKIEKKEWETTSEGVSYLASSPLPGATGNSILYGHNWTNLLGNLEKAKSGQVIEIEFKNGEKKHFLIQRLATVWPDQKSVLYPSEDKRITLYTCTGFLDSKRFVVVATTQD